eukprot:7921489-Lingulodinium_polyedra.AAC.1
MFRVIWGFVPSLQVVHGCKAAGGCRRPSPRAGGGDAQWDNAFMFAMQAVVFDLYGRRPTAS